MQSRPIRSEITLKCNQLFRKYHNNLQILQDMFYYSNTVYMKDFIRRYFPQLYENISSLVYTIIIYSVN